MLVSILHPKQWGKRSSYRLEANALVMGVFIPKGFVTDGVTFPQGAMLTFLGMLLLSIGLDIKAGMWLFSIALMLGIMTPIVGKSFPAALLHDYLLTSEGVTRKAADKYFYTALIAYGIPKWISIIYYCAVRANSIYRAVFSK